MKLLVIICTLLLHSTSQAASLPRQISTHSPCRFAPRYTQEQILKNSSDFVRDIFYWDGQFHQNGVGLNTQNGLTYDGCILNGTTGIANQTERHDFSAPSKEALQVMMYVHAIAGNHLASTFVYPEAYSTAAEYAVAMLSEKLNAYKAFNATYPGYGGYLPWFLANGTESTDMRPTSDWENRVPALDNGELLWAIYAAVQVLRTSNAREYVQLAGSWQRWLDYTKVTGPMIFYNGTGNVCSVVDLNMTVLPNSPHQNYTCEPGTPGTLNDPYEGELFTWWLYFYGNLSTSDRTALWTVKRPQLVAVNYTGSIVNTSYSDPIATNYTDLPVTSRTIGPITVQRGFWFSSHEQWKLLEMPYLSVPLVKRIYHNAERVRTCNSVLMGKNAGMFAAVNNITDPTTGQIDGYISYAGIPSVANQTEQELDVITPYSVFPTLLFNQSVGLAWYKNMLDAKGGQNLYGSTESIRRDGTGVGAFVSWDSKVTTDVALLGGVGPFVKKGLMREGLYEEFVDVLEREYGRVFQHLAGEDVDLCLPQFQVPVANVTDFTGCA